MDDWFQEEKLHFAAEEGDLKKVKELVEQGRDINAVDEGMNITPLHYAVREEHYDVVEYLISIGANVNAHVEELIGETPLGDVAPTCSYRMADLLVKAGADPTIPGCLQITALDSAKKRKDQEGIKVYELLAYYAKKLAK